MFRHNLVMWIEETRLNFFAAAFQNKKSETRFHRKITLHYKAKHN